MTKAHGEAPEMKTKWLLTGVTVDGRQEFNEELGELTAEEATSKSAVLIQQWTTSPGVDQCWLFYEQDDGKGSGTMLWKRSRPVSAD
jgi:hypothetical protein